MVESLARPASPSPSPVRVVVIGYGPVGARLVEGLVPSVAAGTVSVTVVGAEPHDAYNRVLIAEHAVGRASRERLDTTDTAGALATGVDIRLGSAVVGIDRARQVVRLDDDERVPYDRLVFATGARANIPTLDGLERSRRDRRTRALLPENLDRGAAPLPHGVVSLRDLADAAVVRAAVDAKRRIVVLGAGVLGMEIALAAAEQGADVVAVHHGDAPMARNLDRGGGRMLARAAHRAGVTMAAHSRAESILFHEHTDGSRSFQALVCADGKQIEGDLLLLSCGVGARTELAASCDLAVSTGILVDEELRSWTDPAVFAIGDCAHVASRGSAGDDGRVPGGPSGLIGPGWRQADWLAERLGDEAAGRSSSATPPLADERPSVVMLKAEGIDVVSAGDVSADPFDDEPSVLAASGSGPGSAAGSGAAAAAGSGSDASGCPVHSPREVTQWADPARGHYVKIVTRGGVLEGFVAVGLPRVGAELTLLFERGDELPADRSSLLRLDAPDAGVVSTSDPMAPDATVCWCNGVTVERITSAAEAGDTTIECVGRSTRAGTGCGGCKGRIAEILAAVAA